MYYRRIIRETLKYAQTCARYNYMVMNICLSNLKRNTYKINNALQIYQIKAPFYRMSYEQSSAQTKLLVASVFSFLFNIHNTEEEKDDVAELETTIKRSILLIQKGEFPKAEQMLHIALRQAQILQHYDGITYVYDVMANLAYGLSDFKKAEKLFISVLQRLISKGVAEDDLAVIHISLKIANMYAKMGDTEKAESGFKFCIQNLQKHLIKDSENVDVLQILGLSLEWYASMLFSQLQYADALNYLTQAYDISLKINGEEHEQTVILLNDLGTTNCMIKKYDQAIEYLSKAIDIGKKLPDLIDIGAVYVNLGNVLIAKGLYREAKKNCVQGMHLATVNNHDESKIEAEKCLERIKNLTM
ncbi:tetratricopeptide repeat domain 19 [Calliopsis andreniformis]|uniref:tetratricopeptide repeat domain 19 n=1 Tax=Calliopsis andreniformis TaxID=337506 RepID=UPI003FCCA75C